MTGLAAGIQDGNNYAAVAQPNHIETVIAKLPTGAGGANEMWKYTRYWDNPAFWTSPNSQNVETITSGRFDTAGSKTATTTVKALQPTSGQVATPPDEFEVYIVPQDTTEMRTLYSASAAAPTGAIWRELI